MQSEGSLAKNPRCDFAGSLLICTADFVSCTSREDIAYDIQRTAYDIQRYGWIYGQRRMNPVVFFDISIGGTHQGRVKMELFADVAPRTAENFRQLCTGELRDEAGAPLGYKGTSFHRVIRGFMVQGGDFVNGDGTGAESIYGGEFDDETFALRHSGPGLLSMANQGPNTNGCQFFVTCAKCDFLDGKHVVFGRVIDGLLVLRKIENVPTGPNDRPSLPVLVTECGEM